MSSGGRWIIGERLAYGTRAMGRDLGAWLTVRELAGRERVKLMAQRAGGAFVSAWFVGGILYALGVLKWVVALGWIGAALYASRDYRPAAPSAPKPPAREERAVDLALFGERDVLLLALAEILGDRAGIHLWRLYEQLRTWGTFADLDDKQIRKLLELHGVPVHKSITADKVSGRSGIKRADVVALLAPPPPAGAPLSTGETGRDLRESRSLSAPGAAPEGDSCTEHELGDDTLAMLREVS